MKKLMSIIAVTLCVLLLAGCAKSEDLQKDNQPTPAAPEESQIPGDKPDAEALPKPSPESDTEIEDTPAPEETHESIGEPGGVLLEIHTNADASGYKALSAPVIVMDYYAEAHEDLQTNTILLNPQKNMRILIERVEYLPALNWFETAETLFDFLAKPGEVYSLTTFLAETIPNVRITAIADNGTASWYCVYDGSGERDVQYLTPEEPATPEFMYGALYIVPISCAAAVSHELFGDDAFWETIAHAVTLVEAPEPESGPITLSQERFFQYVEATYPGYTAWPELIEEITYNETDNTYSFVPYNNDPVAKWEFVNMEENRGSGGGSVWISVTCPNISNKPVIYEATWNPKENRAVDDPFAFEMYNIFKHEQLD